ncbi:MAG TPA: UDP-N-acetylglucosamine--N-acetylmuramyl-(pentapeptide) pyrophosphoryl-undecaprenol N-acetylglucosamine transferase [Gaiellaceae bacterium]|nr:UDP-N-acetylglucosamine--N-acetylmuramyl-(pentapeptide) pyrophosphoryl-undecaprenol N-acetylglucosamine transferase [Gaiellaceae bacterium]
MPALAVADALRARGARVTFAGSPERAEARLVPEAGYELDTFRVSGLPRQPGLAQARAALHALAAPAACDRILARRKPDAVLGAGGYVGGPMVVAAARRRLPTALTEADAHLGLANRLAAPFAKRVFLSFPIPGREPPKYVVTGRPIPARSRPLPREEARRKLDLPGEGPVLLVAGGSQGARALNDLAVEAFGAAGPAVIHLSGEREHERLRGLVSREDYRLLPFMDDYGAVLGAVDLAVSRAGGGTWELAAAGIPAVLVPYPFGTADHQTKNARYFQAAGGAILIPETGLGRVPETVRSLLDDPRRLEAMSTAMRRVAKPDAAETIAEELTALAAARG